MKIYFKVPFNSWLNGPSTESLNVHTSFEEKAYLVNVNIEGESPLELENEAPETKYFRRAKSLNFDITLKDEALDRAEDFKRLITEEANRLELFRLLVNIVNRMLRSIRNFGTVPHLQEIHPKDSDVEPIFRKWGVKYSDNETESHSCYPELHGFNSLLSAFSLSNYDTPQKTPSLNVSHWPDIEEAIQDKLQPSPEQEFFTNAVEFLRTRNFRMALLESVICLEIVLTQYLKAFLTIRKELPKNRIKKFLSDNMGLSSRLSGLLNLTLNEDYLKKTNIEKILQAVEWRNHIIHKTGNLPAQINEDSLSDGISSVVSHK